MKVEVRGVVYASVPACADALGLARQTVYGAIRKGRTDFLGFGTGTPMRIAIRGVTYDSVKHAADALGVKEITIHCAIIRGRLDRVGLGIDYKARKVRGSRRRPITIAGKAFETTAELARFIGRERRSVYVSLKGGEASRAGIARAVMERLAKAENKAMLEAWKDAA